MASLLYIFLWSKTFIIWLIFMCSMNTIYVHAESDCNATNTLQHIKNIDWETIGQHSNNTPNINVSLSVSQYDLTLSIIAQLEYLGYSTADGTDGYGTTYTLDFKSSNAHSLSISNPSACSNRLSSSYNNTPFASWWQYSECPFVSNQIGQLHSFLAYPKPSNYWNLYMSENNMIVYDGKFKLTDLLSCDSESNAVQSIASDKWWNISGTFYVNLVSPLAKSADFGYYYIYQLFSAPFVIAVQRTINVVSSTGISLFTMTFVAVYKQETQSNYKLILLTESADYLYLDLNQLLIWPNSNEIEFLSTNTGNEKECVAVKNSICSQLFVLRDKDTECANDLLSGEYMIRFDVKCNPNINATESSNEYLEICQNWLSTHDNYIDLEASLHWKDNVCSPKTYLVQFQGQIDFYVDDTFSDNALQTNDGLYEIGMDRVYVRVSLANHQSADDVIYDMIAIQLNNVWLCTVAETEQLSLDTEGDGNGGCFASALVDNDGPYHIYESNEIAQGYDDIDIQLHNDDANDIRFSFIVPQDIVRTKLYVHSQITIDVITTNAQRRRLLLVSDMEFNQILHYMQSIKLAKESVEHKLREQQKDIRWWTVFVVSALVTAFAAIVFAVYVVVKHYQFKYGDRSIFDTLANYSKYISANESVLGASSGIDSNDENHHLIWRNIREDQSEKANSA